jgi:osmotically-inducible protein OsmY
VGIRGVANDIRLSEPQLTPNAVRDAIENALERRALHRSRKIDVIVDDGAVILRGTVESLGQKRTIREAVGHAPGVDIVCDELNVENAW